MKAAHFVRIRPVLATLLATVAVLAILFVIPISYERTAGHDVTLTLAGTGLDAAALGRIASELKGALAVPGVRVRQANDTVTMEASSAERSRRTVEATAEAFAATLNSKGIATETRVVPRTEHVSSNVYAVAMNRAIELRIERAGRSPAEIEADVRRQLEAAGITNSEVHYTQDGDQNKLEVRAQGGSSGEPRDFKIEIGGTGDDAINSNLHRFEVRRTAGMTDADVKADIERQMREAGVQGEVTVENGRVEVKVHKQN